MKIVIWTESPPKVAAIREAIEKCPYFAGKNPEIITTKVSSEISDMPTSMTENMLGAKNRAKNAKKSIPDADFYIGMEGGTDFIWEKSYLFGVVYVLAKNGEWHFGMSNMVEVPKIFHEKIYFEKKELGPILSEITGVADASKKNGAFGAWTNDVFTRKDQFIFAFLSAMAPFYNEYYEL